VRDLRAELPDRVTRRARRSGRSRGRRRGAGAAGRPAGLARASATRQPSSG